MSLLPTGQRTELRPGGTQKAEAGLKPVTSCLQVLCSYSSVVLGVSTGSRTGVAEARTLCVFGSRRSEIVARERVTV